MTKTTAQKAVNTEVYVQFWGKEIYAKDVVEMIKKVWTDEMGKKASELKRLESIHQTGRQWRTLRDQRRGDRLHWIIIYNSRKTLISQKTDIRVFCGKIIFTFEDSFDTIQKCKKIGFV